MPDQPSAPQSDTSADNKLKEPIFCCAIFDSPDFPDIPPKDHPMFLQGIYDFEKRTAEPIKSVLLRSLEFMGYVLPPGFSLIACEVFYHDKHIDEVRCGGSYISEISADGEVKYDIWTTPIPPRFTMTLHREMVLALQDAGRTCVVASQAQSVITISWDLRAHGFVTLGDDAEGCIIMVMEQDDPPEDTSEAARIKAYLAETAKSLHGQPLEVLRQYVRSRPPADAGEHRTIVARDDVSSLTYIYDVERIEYSFKSGYADSIKLSQEEVEGYKREFSLSEDEAKAFLLLKHLMARDEFTTQGLASFEQKARRFLEDTSSYLRQEANTLALVEWQHSEGQPVQDIKAMKKAVLEISNEMTRQRLEMQGRGRPEGSRTVRDEEESHRLNREHRGDPE